MSHTPGPWEIRVIKLKDIPPSLGVFQKSAEAAWFWPRIAVVDSSYGECQDNSRLIAAAPELLEALQEFVRDQYENPAGQIIVSKGSVDIAREAISKATGK